MDPLRQRGEDARFGIVLVRVWRERQDLRMRVLTRRGVERGDEFVATYTTANTEEAVQHVRQFLASFSARDADS